MSRIRTYVHSQFRRPRGPLGYLAGRLMSGRSSNTERSVWTVSLLELAPDARVLELGYGPGVGIEAALAAAPQGEVVGLDHSETMRSMAAARNAEAVSAGRATLLVGDAERLPDGFDDFDAIFSCNVWKFWSDQVATLGQLRSRLAPGGRLAVTHMPRSANADRSDTVAAAELIEQQLRTVGFTQVSSEYRELQPVPAACVLADAD